MKLDAIRFVVEIEPLGTSSKSFSPKDNPGHRDVTLDFDPAKRMVRVRSGKMIVMVPAEQIAWMRVSEEEDRAAARGPGLAPAK